MFIGCLSFGAIADYDADLRRIRRLEVAWCCAATHNLRARAHDARTDFLTLVLGLVALDCAQVAP